MVSRHVPMGSIAAIAVRIADATSQACSSDALTDALGDLDQRGIPAGMTVQVVDRLEVVQVHGDQCQWLTEAPGALTLLLERFLQAIAVGGTGQRIPLGQLAVLIQLPLQLLVDP
ncbi:hypothetical protein WR25_14999 [Diploscapter pachys]|uniref:Uncharacterized protein n=1 Tax=Diploscapter pachys TaxID=2018661 RepID=A0A2A2JZ16_9BILA|nr:hypothetical protein WR25_14999 [Diploscapter pachys]